MHQTLTLESRLPELRAELQLLPGITDNSGVRSWLVFDPVRHRYFQLDNDSLTYLQNWEVSTVKDLLLATGKSLNDIASVESLLRFLIKNSLTRDPPEGNSAHYAKQQLAAKKNWLFALLHNYLFVRVPLIRPHALLRRTAHLTNFFYSSKLLVGMSLVAALALYLVSRQWDSYISTFKYFFNSTGLVYYVAALVFVKCVHELGHAYTATRFGCRVTTMGVAFLVMFPVLFTDTTDTWKLRSKKQRLAVAGAGIVVELMIATIATLLWVFMPEGALRSTMFFIATVSWVMSIAVNLNPLMRFDGYHLLSDFIGIQNLQERSFSLGKWRLRKLLFGFKEPAPELLSGNMTKGLIAFAWSTWLYRLFLFLGIAILIHQMFFKPLGTVLAVVEILFFIVIPIFREFQQWFNLRGEMTMNMSSLRTSVLLLLLISVFVIPWQQKIRIPAVLESNKIMPIFSPRPAEVISMLVAEGDHVEIGEPLFTLSSPELENEIDIAKSQLKVVKIRMNQAVNDRQARNESIVVGQEQQELQHSLSSLLAEKERLTIKSDIKGVVTDLDKSVHPGRWVSNDLQLASIVSADRTRIRGYIGANDLIRIENGSDVEFVPEVLELEKQAGVISLIDAIDVDEIAIEKLSSVHGGPISVSNNQDKFMTPLNAWYNIYVDSEKEMQPIGQVVRGTLHANGKPESIAIRVLRQTFRVLLGEVVI